MNIDTKRHKLLGILTEQRKNVELEKPEYNSYGVTFDKIYKLLNCDPDELQLITSELFTSDEIGYHDANNIVGLFAKKNGKTAFSNEKYKRRIIERKKELVKFILLILALLISLGSLYFSKITNIDKSRFNKQTKEMQLEIDTLKFQVDKLKEQFYNNSNKNRNKDSLNFGKN